jgi:hypothetical protein
MKTGILQIDELSPKARWRRVVTGTVAALTAALVVVAMTAASAAHSPSPLAVGAQSLSAPESVANVDQALMAQDTRETELGSSQAASINCPTGQLPLLNVARYPAPGAHGAVTPAAAVSAADPAVGLVTLVQMGRSQKAPYWGVAGARTFIVTALPDGGWFAAAASFIRCYDPSQQPHPAPSGSGPVG